MWFLSVGPEVCLQLPSDSISRWTPLLFSYTLPTIWACSGLSPIRARPWRANYQKTGCFISGLLHHLFYLGFLFLCVWVHLCIKFRSRKMKYTFLDLLCTSLIPELCSNITAGTACDTHLVLITVTAVWAFPDQLT